ncbi:MAG: class I SAM-dependent methyltransferase [Pirellulales bacterium]
MTIASTAGREIDWLAIAACPDCAAAVEPSGSSMGAVCTSCGRSFEVAASGLNLLPRGMALRDNEAAPTSRGWRSRFVAAVYTRHNRSVNVRRALDRVLGTLGDDDWGLNVGSANTRYHARLLNLDVAASQDVDVVATAERLPFRDDSLACAVSQEVFEHLTDPARAAREVLRVLRPGGLFYFQVPFIIGFHSGPHDYWRFTHRGVEQLLTTAGFEMVEIGAAVGPGTSMYRIGVEFFATTVAAISRRLYMPAKALAAMLCAPLRWTDFVAREYSDTNRIAAGFFAIARKPLHRS